MSVDYSRVIHEYTKHLKPYRNKSELLLEQNKS